MTQWKKNLAGSLLCMTHVCKNNLNLFILCLGIPRQKESWLFFHFKSDTITYIQFWNLFHFPPSLKLSRTATYLVFIWSYCHMNFFDFPSSWKDLYMRSLGHLLPLFVARSYDHANENSLKDYQNGGIYISQTNDLMIVHCIGCKVIAGRSIWSVFHLHKY
jgi:hypothetical protein